MSERSGFLIFTRFYHYIIRSYQIDYVAEMVSLPECGLLCEWAGEGFPYTRKREQ